jgi:four helix bundle protein
VAESLSSNSSLAGKPESAPRVAKDFEDLRVFREARRLSKRAYELTSKGPITRERALVDQLRRASVSVMSNIAEGFDSQSNAEFVRFLYVARKSCAEIRGESFVALDQNYWTKEVVNEIQSGYRGLSIGVAKLIRYLAEADKSKKKSK